nr:hypothetical protein [Thalassoglobus neptunius]
MLPFKGLDFRGTPEPAEPSQREDEPPILIGTSFQDLLGHLSRDEVISFPIRENGSRYGFHSERILGDEFPVNGVCKELGGDRTHLASRVLAFSVRQEKVPKVFGIADRKRIDQSGAIEAFHQQFETSAPDKLRRSFDVRSGIDKLPAKILQ